MLPRPETCRGPVTHSCEDDLVNRNACVLKCITKSRRPSALTSSCFDSVDTGAAAPGPARKVDASRVVASKLAVERTAIGVFPLLDRVRGLVLDPGMTSIGRTVRCPKPLTPRLSVTTSETTCSTPERGMRTWAPDSLRSPVGVVMYQS